MDLGVKRPTGPEVAPAAPESPKVSYPSFTVRDDIAKQLKKVSGCDLGEEFTATVKVKCTGLRSDQYGTSLDFDLLDLTPDSETGSETDEEVKTLGYKRPEVTKPAPPVGADSID